MRAAVKYEKLNQEDEHDEEETVVFQRKDGNDVDDQSAGLVSDSKIFPQLERAKIIKNETAEVFVKKQRLASKHRCLCVSCLALLALLALITFLLFRKLNNSSDLPPQHFVGTDDWVLKLNDRSKWEKVIFLCMSLKSVVCCRK